MSQQFVSSLEQTLREITQPNTQAIKNASAKLQSEFYKVPESVLALMEIARAHPDAQLRQLAGVEARKLVPLFWNQLDNQKRTESREQILQATFQEQVALVRHTLSRVVAAIALEDLNENNWPEILPFLDSKTQSETATDREVSVYLLYALLDADCEPLRDAPCHLLQILARTIQMPESSLSSVLAIGKVGENITVSDNESLPERDQAMAMYRELVPLMVQVLQTIVQAGDDEKAATQIFDVLNGMLLYDSGLMTKQQLTDLISFMCQIAREGALADEFRSPALQFLLTAVRFRKNKISQLKMGPEITESALAVIAQPIDVEDLLKDNAASPDEEDEEELWQTAYRLIEGLASVLPASQVSTVILSKFNSLDFSNPFAVRAVFLGITGSVEGSPDFYADELDTVMPPIISGLSQNEVIQAAALQAITALATEMHTLLGENFHQQLVPAILPILEGTSHIRLARLACAAIDSVLETLPTEVITQVYLDVLVPKLLSLLQRASDDRLRGNLVAAIASAAFAAKEAYIPHFESTMKIIEPLLSNLDTQITSAGDTEQSEKERLAGMTLDAVSAIAPAVGSEVFQPYVQPLARVAFHCVFESDACTLRECGYLFMGTLSRMYGQEFVPFLGELIPAIFKSFDQQEFVIEDAEEDDEEGGPQIGLDDEDDDKFPKVNTEIAGEKEIALETLAEIISGVKTGFAPYIEMTIKKMPEFMDHFLGGIRKAALAVLFRLFTVFYEEPSTRQQAIVIGDTARSLSLEALTTEDERETVTGICEYYCEALRLAGSEFVGNASDCSTLCTEITLVLQGSHPCQVDDLFDDEEALKQSGEIQTGELSEYDLLLYDSAMDVVVQLARVLKDQFPFDHFTKDIIQLCSSPNSKVRAAAVGSLAEIVSGVEHIVTSYTQQFLEIFGHGLADKDLEVRSNAAYGVGLLAVNSQDAATVKAAYPEVLKRLERLLKKVEKKKRKSTSDDEEDNSARSLANACGCVARMARAHPDALPLNEVVRILLTKLPLEEEFIENTPIFELIAELVSTGNPAITGHIDQVLDILVGVFAQEAAGEEPFETEELKSRVVEMIRFIKANSPDAVASRPQLAGI